MAVPGRYSQLISWVEINYCQDFWCSLRKCLYQHQKAKIITPLVNHLRCLVLSLYHSVRGYVAPLSSLFQSLCWIFPYLIFQLLCWNWQGLFSIGQPKKIKSWITRNISLKFVHILFTFCNNTPKKQNVIQTMIDSISKFRLNFIRSDGNQSTFLSTKNIRKTLRKNIRERFLGYINNLLKPFIPNTLFL